MALLGVGASLLSALLYAIGTIYARGVLHTTSPLPLVIGQELVAGIVVLHLAWPHATEPDATISGGVTAVPPEGMGTHVTVRGQRGTLYTLGQRLAVTWTEDGQLYMIYSTLRQSELLALANDLEALDLATFRARLRPQ